MSRNPTHLKTLPGLLLLAALILPALAGCAGPTATPEQATLPPMEVPTQPEARPTDTETPPEATATATPAPSETPTAAPAEPALPAPLYFLYGPDETEQIWRIEMNGGFAHPVTALPAGVDAYDVSPADGSLAYVSNNDLFVSLPDGSQAQMIVDGDDIAPDDHESRDRRLGSPAWSEDGGSLAYSRNGIHVISLPSGGERTLITDVPFEMTNVAAGRVYTPMFWSPDGNTLAVSIGYYEGAELGILPAGGGELAATGVDTCCATPGPDDDSFFLGSAGGMGGPGGMWRVEWSTGQAEQISPPYIDGTPMDIYAQPHYTGGDLLYLFGSELAPQIVRSDPADLGTREVLGQLEYQPPQALWSPGGDLMVMPAKRPEDPMLLWTPGGEPRPLEMPGGYLKWGVATDADLALAATPAPTFTPTPTLPALPPSSQVINRGNAAALQALTTVSGRNEVYSLDISPDGRLLALGLETGVELWDLTSMQRAARLGPYAGIVPALKFSPDSRYLAAGSWDRSLDLWDVSTGEKARSFAGHSDWVEAVAFSPDGEMLASASSDTRLILWDTASGSPLREVDTGHWVSDIAFSPDGALFAWTGWDNDVRIMEVESWTEYAVIPYEPERWTLNLAFSPDGKTLALATWDYRVVLWDVETKSARAELYGHSDNPTGLSFSPDGSLLATAAEDGEMRIWDTATGEQVHLLPGDRSAAFSPDGRFLIAAGPRITGAVIYYVP